MGFLDAFRAKAKLTVAAAGLVALVAAGPRAEAQTPAPLTTPSGTISQVIPLSSAEASGAFGSEWKDRLLLRNPTDATLSGKIYVAERSTSFDPTTTPFFTYSLPPGTTTVIEGTWGAVHDTPGAGTLYLEGDQASTPIARAQMFNQHGAAEFGAQALGFDPAVDGYFPAGTTLGTVLSGDGYRDNPHLHSGPNGVTGRFVYTNGANADRVEVPVSLGPNTTAQYTLAAILGFSPAPNGTLDFTVDAGDVRAYLSRNNNTTSDPAYDEMEPIVKTNTIPKILGLDLDGDGKPNVVDADGNGVLDDVIDVSCGAPFNYEHRIITTAAPGTVNFFGEALPAGMGVNSGTGLIGYNPPCSDSGQFFTPAFYVTGMNTVMEATYRVGD